MLTMSLATRHQFEHLIKPCTFFSRQTFGWPSLLGNRLVVHSKHGRSGFFSDSEVNKAFTPTVSNGEYRLVCFTCAGCKSVRRMHASLTGMNISCGNCGKTLRTPARPIEVRYTAKRFAEEVRTKFAALSLPCLFAFSGGVQRAWEKSCELLDGDAFESIELPNPSIGQYEKTYSREQGHKIIDALIGRANGNFYGIRIDQTGVAREGWWGSTELFLDFTRADPSTLARWIDTQIGCPILGWADEKQEQVAYVPMTKEPNYLGCGSRNWHFMQYATRIREAMALHEKGVWMDGDQRCLTLERFANATNNTPETIRRRINDGEIECVDRPPYLGSAKAIPEKYVSEHKQPDPGVSLPNEPIFTIPGAGRYAFEHFEIAPKAVRKATKKNGCDAFLEKRLPTFLKNISGTRKGRKAPHILRSHLLQFCAYYAERRERPEGFKSAPELCEECDIPEIKKPYINQLLAFLWEQGIVKRETRLNDQGKPTFVYEVDTLNEYLGENGLLQAAEELVRELGRAKLAVSTSGQAATPGHDPVSETEQGVITNQAQRAHLNGVDADEHVPTGDAATAKELATNGDAAGLKGPLGIRYFPAERKVERAGKTVLFGSRDIPWKMFESLCKRYPGYYRDGDLGHDACNPASKDLEPELQTVWRHISRVRRIVKKLGIVIKNVRGLGYRLEPKQKRNIS
jgi:hypothetical protein